MIAQSGSREPTVQKQSAPSGKSGQSASHGRVLFVKVDRAANTIIFVTESGSLWYSLLTPTEVPVGSYRFAVTVSGNNLTLTAPGEATDYAPFRYRIAHGQPNPATLLRGESHVDVMVVENDSTVPSSTTSTPGSPAATNDVSSVQFEVEVLTPDAFKAATGLSAETLPEGSLVSGSSLTPTGVAAALPQDQQSNFDRPFPPGSSGAGLLPGIGGASGPRPVPIVPDTAECDRYPLDSGGRWPSLRIRQCRRKHVR